jgi:hypothetical protein
MPWLAALGVGGEAAAGAGAMGAEGATATTPLMDSAGMNTGSEDASEAPSSGLSSIMQKLGNIATPKSTPTVGFDPSVYEGQQSQESSFTPVQSAKLQALSNISNPTNVVDLMNKFKRN